MYLSEILLFKPYFFCAYFALKSEFSISLSTGFVIEVFRESIATSASRPFFSDRHSAIVKPYDESSWPYILEPIGVVPGWRMGFFRINTLLSLQHGYFWKTAIKLPRLCTTRLAFLFRVFHLAEPSPYLAVCFTEVILLEC